MQKNKGLSGAVLKAIALLAMFIDHFAVVIVQGVLLPRASSANIEAMRTAYTIMRGIGRIAFPIYCVLLAEGLRYTHDRFRYLMQLLLLAVLSEIPYDLAFSSTWIAPKEQNIFWTLMLSLLVIWLFDIAYEKVSFLWYLASVVLFFLACVAANILGFDYGMFGIMAVAAAYITGKSRGARAFAVPAVLFGQGVYIAASIPILLLYNGTRGKQNKWFFYLFYPGHLIFLICLRQFVFFFR